VLYLSGGISQSLLGSPRPDIGLMFQPGQGYDKNRLAAFWKFALDNGCYAQGASFDAGDWLEWLAGLRRYRANCLFALAPDVLADYKATYNRSEPYMRTIRQLGFPAGFVAQDGINEGWVPWDETDCLFIGGTTDWKLSEDAWAIAAVARARGKWVHMGRVNSFTRLRAARSALLDSVDGTQIRWRPDVHLPALHDWLDAVNGQHTLAA